MRPGTLQETRLPGLEGLPHGLLAPARVEPAAPEQVPPARMPSALPVLLLAALLLWWLMGGRRGRRWIRRRGPPGSQGPTSPAIDLAAALRSIPEEAGAVYSARAVDVQLRRFLAARCDFDVRAVTTAELRETTPPDELLGLWPTVLHLTEDIEAVRFGGDAALRAGWRERLDRAVVELAATPSKAPR